MPPIPIHKNSPISAAAAKPDGVNPQTDANQQQAPPPPTTTSAASNGAAYAPAQPGQPAVPAPTGAINQPYSHQMPPPPTQTYPLPAPRADAPPPPQPGAVPIPAAPSAQAPPPTTQFVAPPAQPPTNPAYAPPQMAMAPPQANQAPTHSTFVPSPSQPQHPRPPPATSADLSHPPGYSQDTRASEMTAAQRAVQQQQEKQDSLFAGFGDASSSAAGTFRTGVLGSAGSAPGNATGTAGGAVGESGVAAPLEGAWGAAKQWMSGVADKVTEMEGEVWKKVNGEK